MKGHPLTHEEQNKQPSLFFSFEFSELVSGLLQPLSVVAFGSLLSNENTVFSIMYVTFPQQIFLWKLGSPPQAFEIKFCGVGCKV